jgi:hypothetical protein
VAAKILGRVERKLTAARSCVRHSSGLRFCSGRRRSSRRRRGGRQAGLGWRCASATARPAADALPNITSVPLRSSAGVVQSPRGPSWRLFRCAATTPSASSAGMYCNIERHLEARRIRFPALVCAEKRYVDQHQNDESGGNKQRRTDGLASALFITLSAHSVLSPDGTVR